MTTFSTTSATPSPIYSSPSSPFKKQKMSITQTYFLAHKARAKLSHEAAMPDHNLRLLVGHANLLDSLMVELADAEREQESWFNQSVRTAQQPERKAAAASADRHIQWADTIAEEEEEEDEEDYDSASSSEDDESDFDEDEDVEMAGTVSLRRVPSNHGMMKMLPPSSPTMEVMEIDMLDEDEDDHEVEAYPELTLTRSPSHHSIASASPPPELEHDLDDSSDDEAMPPSPPSTLLPTFETKQQQATQHQQSQHPQKHEEAIAQDSTDYYDGIHYARNPAGLVTAISVY